MGTTDVPAERTAGEIMRLLGKAGAKSIVTDYERGEVSGMRWKMNVDGREAIFSMPVRVGPIFTVIQRQRSTPQRKLDNTDRDHAQATRVAWRQLLRWVQAQLAFAETGMVEPAEIFSPYIVMQNGQTLFAAIQGNGFKMLGDGK
jgi:hypothetical protein